MDYHKDFGDGQASQTSAIADYIARGISHGCGDCIGLELEHFVVTKDAHALVPYFDNPDTGDLGVQSILEKLVPFYDEAIFEEQKNGSKYLIALSREYANITLEPGAQLEISIGPVLEVRDLEVVYTRFQEELYPILAENGYELLSLGYHPTSCAQEIPLIPKERYFFMDKQFETTGKHGICMMRATASTQVSIDFESEEDAIRKFRIAHALSPLFAFITDNSPLFEGEHLGSKKPTRSGLTLPPRMVRTAIWDDVDPVRAMTTPHTFDDHFDFSVYAESILNAPAIFTIETDSDGKKSNVWQGTRSFSEALAGRTLDRQTIEHILSLFFYDVRLKTYIEIRAADSLPIDYALAFAAFIKGLFYLKENVAILEKHFEHITAESIISAKADLLSNGYTALVYGRPVTDWLDELIVLASQGLKDPERTYLAPLAHLIATRSTLIEPLKS
jgi:glutamate--cysteine ligase